MFSHFFFLIMIEKLLCGETTLWIGTALIQTVERNKPQLICWDFVKSYVFLITILKSLNLNSFCLQNTILMLIIVFKPKGISRMRMRQNSIWKCCHVFHKEQKQKQKRIKDWKQIFCIQIFNIKLKQKIILSAQIKKKEKRDRKKLMFSNL